MGVDMPIFGQKDKEYQTIAKMLAEGYNQDAITRLRKFREENHKHTNAMVTLAVALIQAQKQPKIDAPETIEALALLDKATEMKPKDPVPRFNKGVCLRSLGMLEEALECFQSALALQERFSPAILHMAEINYELERWENAVMLARLALIRDPALEASLNWVPTAMRKAGYLDEDGNVGDVPWKDEKIVDWRNWV